MYCICLHENGRSDGDPIILETEPCFDRCQNFKHDATYSILHDDS